MPIQATQAQIFANDEWTIHELAHQLDISTERLRKHVIRNTVKIVRQEKGVMVFNKNTAWTIAQSFNAKVAKAEKTPMLGYVDDDDDDEDDESVAEPVIEPVAEAATAANDTPTDTNIDNDIKLDIEALHVLLTMFAARLETLDKHIAQKQKDSTQ